MCGPAGRVRHHRSCRRDGSGPAVQPAHPGPAQRSLIIGDSAFVSFPLSFSCRAVRRHETQTSHDLDQGACRHDGSREARSALATGNERWTRIGRRSSRCVPMRRPPVGAGSWEPCSLNRRPSCVVDRLRVRFRMDRPTRCRSGGYCRNSSGRCECHRSRSHLAGRCSGRPRWLTSDNRHYVNSAGSTGMPSALPRIISSTNQKAQSSTVWSIAGARAA